MALLPDVHVNLDRLTFENAYQRAYQIVLPLIPGWTLVGGFTFAYPHIAYGAAATLGLGRYSRVAVFLCSVYVAGLVLYGFSLAVTIICSIALTGFVLKNAPVRRTNEVQSKATIFRRVAAEFLGTLAPAIAGNDVEWLDFYNVLQDYVLRGTPILNNEAQLFLAHLQATAWALMYLYWKTAIRGHWSVLVVSITLILFGATLPFGAH